MPEITPKPLFKVLVGDNTCCARGTWSLPTASGPGEWADLSTNGACGNDRLLTDDPADRWSPGAKAYAVEQDGDRIRLVRELSDDELAEHRIYSTGEHVVDSGTVIVVGNATVRAWDSATVRAWGNATVEAWGNATVEAWGNATVRASDNATVRASDNATVRAWGNATVEAWGNATVTSWWGNPAIKIIEFGVHIDRRDRAKPIIHTPDCAVVVTHPAAEVTA